MLTPQEAFTKMVNHLTKQQGRSFGLAGLCMYRSPDGLMCAVGCLIPDEQYVPQMDGMGGADILGGTGTEFLAKDYPELVASMGLQVWQLEHMQRVHDCWQPDKDLQPRLAELAETWGLQMPHNNPIINKGC